MPADTRLDADRNASLGAEHSAGPAVLQVLRKLSPFIGLAIFGLALYALHDWLRPQRYHEVQAALRALPASRLGLAALLAGASYTVLIGYDWLALKFVGHRLRLPTVAGASFLANAMGNNFGATLITGATVRYWTYTSAGLSAFEITRVVLFCSAGFWLGFLLLGGVVFTFFPMRLPEALQWAGDSTRPLGMAFLALIAAGLALLIWRQRFLRRAGSGALPSPLPSPMLAAKQMLVAAVDLYLMTGVLYALLPPAAGLHFAECAGMLLIALLGANLSLVPGGLGVFESAMVLLLGQRVPVPELASALLMFRVLYYFVPLALAVALVAVRARTRFAWRQRLRAVRVPRPLAAAAPHVVAATAFLAGALLLFSGAVPAAAGRLEVLNDMLVLPLIEASHFTASLAGALLLLLAHALQRRLDAAWYLAMLLLVSGMVLSLLKGLDFEETIVLGLAALVLLSLRREFYRKSSLLGEAFTGDWIAASVMMLAGSAALMFFAHRHAPMAEQTWWTFALHAESARSVRAMVGAVGLTAVLGWYRLLTPMRPQVHLPDAQEIGQARPLILRSPETTANLALRGDKALLFSMRKDAFLMYGRRGRTWVTMGDPIGADEGARDLLWQFADLCDRFGGRCVFFEVGERWRGQYAELGLGMTPIGEEARVDLRQFTLQTPARRKLRQTRARLLRQGLRVEILPREQIPTVLPELARISAAWLAGKATQEKGFSVASFDADYLQQFPLAVVRDEHDAGNVIAFVNLWFGADKQELSFDLMRHLPTVPNGTMDFLFCELMQWGQAEGFHWFNLGMAPLSGVEAQSEAPLWRHVARLLYRHGEHFYNFEGLRQYKAKFDPVWRTRYIASPGGLALPGILMDVATLIAGGMVGLIAKPGRGNAAEGPAAVTME